MKTAWTPYNFIDAHSDLASAFRTFIFGRLCPGDYAKNAVDAAEKLICETFKDPRSSFPMVVTIDGDLYLIPWCYGPEDDNDPSDYGCLTGPKKIKTSYNARRS